MWLRKRPFPPSAGRRARRGRHRTRLWSAVAAGFALLAGVAGALVFGATGALADNPAGNTYVALGDSYSSGEGAPPYLTSSCDRSTSSWVTDFATDLGGNVSYTNDACAGATTADVVSQGQLNALGPNTQVVTITVGGNDLGFGPALTQCTTGISCAGLNISDDTLDALQTTLHNLYQQIVNLAPNATLLVVSYPDIWPADNQPCALETGAMGSGQIAQLHTDTANLNHTIQQASLGVARTQFVDSNTDIATNTPAWTGHDVCASNNENEFNGLADAYNQGHMAAAFHPNSGGYAIWSIIMYRWATQLGVHVGTGTGTGGGGGGGGGGGSGAPAPPAPPVSSDPEPTPSVSSTIIYGDPGGGGGDGGGDCDDGGGSSSAPCN